MKKSIITLLLTILISFIGYSQIARKYAVQLSATVQKNPPEITLNWFGETGVNSYTIMRKLKTNTTGWVSVYANLPGTATQFIDTNIVIGESYEYRFFKSASKFSGYGYINSGIEVPATENRGRLLLVVDTTYINHFFTELNRLIVDMEGDGWSVVKIDVSRNDSVPDVKSKILNEYNFAPTNTKAVFLLGHVPVPYSGNMNPDGHSNHKGAWPADVYYGDVDGNWSDSYVNNTTSSGARNDNVPGDGKFDQTSIPSNIELQVGRVDFANLPKFTLSEQELLKCYLEKNHKYRNKIITVQNRALIDDHFGGFSGEAFAATGWKNFPTLVGTNNIDTYDYDDTLSNNSYLWSYGCGGGSYINCNGVVNTDRFASDSMLSIFTVLFGSYFGDWDSNNNLLRAALASGTTLTNFWSGRPHWQFHHMAMGENIGYSTRLTQNNSSMYYASYAARWVHIALMGEPTLRTAVVAPPANLDAIYQSPVVFLSWTASNTPILGYNIYRKSDSVNSFIRVNNSIISDTFYIDSSLSYSGEHIYMIRAVKLEISASGSYFNLSQGIFDTIMSTASIASFKKQDNLLFSVFPNPSKGKFTLRVWTKNKGIYNLKIIKIDGGIIYSEQLYFDKTNISKEFDFNNLKGFFIIMLTDKKGISVTKKLIII